MRGLQLQMQVADGDSGNIGNLHRLQPCIASTRRNEKHILMKKAPFKWCLILIYRIYSILVISCGFVSLHFHNKVRPFSFRAAPVQDLHNAASLGMLLLLAPSQHQGS